MIKGQAGLTLLELLIGVAMASILCWLISSATLTFFAEYESTKSRMDAEGLRHKFRLNIACEKTNMVQPSPCPVGTAAEIWGQTNDDVELLIPTTGATINTYNLRAKCGSLSHTYVIEYKKPGEPDYRNLFRYPISCP